MQRSSSREDDVQRMSSNSSGKQNETQVTLSAAAQVQDQSSQVQPRTANSCLFDSSNCSEQSNLTHHGSFNIAHPIEKSSSKHFELINSHRLSASSVKGTGTLSANGSNNNHIGLNDRHLELVTQAAVQQAQAAVDGQSQLSAAGIQQLMQFQEQGMTAFNPQVNSRIRAAAQQLAAANAVAGFSANWQINGFPRYGMTHPQQNTLNNLLASNMAAAARAPLSVASLSAAMATMPSAVAAAISTLPSAVSAMANQQQVYANAQRPQRFRTVPGANILQPVRPGLGTQVNAAAQLLRRGVGGIPQLGMFGLEAVAAAANNVRLFHPGNGNHHVSNNYELSNGRNRRQNGRRASNNGGRVRG